MKDKQVSLVGQVVIRNELDFCVKYKHNQAKIRGKKSPK